MYAWNDGNIGSFEVGPQLWGGLFKQYEPNGLPTFPQSFDKVVGRYDVGKVVRNPSHNGLKGLDDALARYAPAAGSPALASAVMKVPYDALGQKPTAAASSIGALEQAK